ncbi:Creatinase/aminopeptidase [Gymnopus androsaceus JB14]|uniref:Creatinase/aminopeptidase n=1 Tax=Gymnopus androsaceus JB14 TaxID=1447944 RepID=A0A6A4IC98_9AGAR|nr:Creatinase/aminopeptidase [Gymnopus androsaceus JB14]
MVYPAQKHALATFRELLKTLPASEKTKPQILLLAGEVTPFRNDTDREIVFRQESNFYYLSGCTVPSSYLLLAFQDGTGLAQKPSVELFIPKAELADMMWSIPPPSLDAAIQTHDVTKIDHPVTLPNAIGTLLKAFPNAMFHTLPRASPLFPVIPEEFTSLVLSPEHKDAAISDLFLLPALHQARLIKDEEEIALIRKANQISSRAHEVVMRVLGKAVKGSNERGPGAGVDRPLLPGEWLIEKEAEAEAIFVASCRREGAVHQAYLPIVAAASRASTLHYCCNDREFAWGPVHPHDHQNRNEFAHGGARQMNPQVLLIDAGCEWNCYASDITRTMPVGNGGKFTPEARAIYELVLEMQKVAMDMIKPGIHWDAVHLMCHRILVKGFQRLGIFKSPSPSSVSSTAPASDDTWDPEHDEEKILASGISSAFYPHGLGHSLGMDVHDVPSASKPAVNPTSNKGLTIGHESFYTYLRLRLPLQKSMVVTVEPGCYFSPHLIAPVRDSKHINQEVLKKYESVGGVRIEDVVVITDDGYENLTNVRSDTEWVEGVCSGAL